MNSKFLLFFLIICSFALSGQSLDVKKQLGFKLLNDEQYQKAIPYFLDVYKKQFDQEVYEALLESYNQLENFTESEKLVKKRLKKSNQSVFYQVDLLQVYKLSKNEKLEKQTLESILENTPDRYDQIASLSDKLKVLNYYGGAIRVLERGAKKNPNYPFYFEKAEIYLLQNNIPEVYNQYFFVLDKDDAFLDQVKGALQTILNDDTQGKRLLYLKKELLKKVQTKKSNLSYSDLLIWLFIQEKNFSAALIQAKALDKRLDEGGQRIYQLAKLAEDNYDDEAALQCYEYLIKLGDNYFYYHKARVKKVELTKKKLLAGEYSELDLFSFEKVYYETIRELGVFPQALELKRELALFQSFYLNKPDTAVSILKESLNQKRISPQELAKTKLVLGDVMVYKNEVWDAVLYYGQVESDFKHDVLGHEAKLKKSKVYFYSGDFDWAKSQLDVLKASTSKLIANDALSLSLLISDNSTIDTNTTLLKLYARAELLHYQKQEQKAINVIDTLMNQISITGDIFDDAMMLKGQCQINLKSYEEAYKSFEEVYNMGSAVSDDALLLMARIQEKKIKSIDKAKELYKKLLLEFPGSVHSIIARKRYRYLRGDLKDTDDINFLYDQNLHK